MRKRFVFLVTSCALALSGCAHMAADQGAPPVRASRADSAGYADYLSARHAASQHDMADAAQFYRASLKTDPQNPELLSRAFLYTASAGDIDAAARLAAQVASRTPDDRAARLTLAIAALKKHDYTEARAQLKKSAAGPFTALTISLIDAWAAVGQNDINGALSEIAQLKSQGGTDVMAAFHRAMIYDVAHRPAEAETAYKNAIKLDATSPRIVEAYGNFLERSGRSAEAQAFYASYAGDITLAPIAKAGQVRIAAKDKPKPFVAQPNDGAAEALFGIAASLSDANSADVSVLYLRYARYLRPGLDLADILLADRLEANGKYADAIAVYRGISKDSPYLQMAQVQIALDESHMDKPDQAIADLKRLTAEHPESVEGWTALGDLYRGKEQYADAANAYDQAIKARGLMDKKGWPLLFARAVSEERSQHWSLAEQDLKEALKLNPEEPQILNFLGYSWVDQGRNLPEALTMLEKARALRPMDGYIADSVGWAYYRLGRYKDAANALESAVLLVPGDPTINQHLGDAYWQVGRKLDAHYQWSHALSFDPDPKQKTELEQRLQSGLTGTNARS